MKFKIICYLLSCFILISLSGCGKDQEYLFGTWYSISIANPDPFFRDTLPDTKYGKIRVTFYESGNFIWIDTSEAKQINGTFKIVDDIFEMNDLNANEKVRLSYQLVKDKLILKTDDGFIFTFEKQ